MYRNYEKSTLEEGVLEVTEGRLTLAAASRAFKIPFGSLYNAFHKLRSWKVGVPTALTAAEESKIVQ
jgi:hypothetical protein